MTFHEIPEAGRAKLLSARAELAALHFQRAALMLGLALKQNFNPAQARVPAGSSGGGRWTGAGGSSGGYAKVAQNSQAKVSVPANERSADPTLTLTARQRDEARRKLVLAGGGGNFFVAPNPNADSNQPWYANLSASMVGAYDDGIVLAASQENVDPDLIRAVMYVETTQGYYFGLGPKLDEAGYSKTILPMNINSRLWSALGSRNYLNQPYSNILAGTKILKGITANLASPSVETVATLYNALDATEVSDYGARVAMVYKSRPWLKR